MRIKETVGFMSALAFAGTLATSMNAMAAEQSTAAAEEPQGGLEQVIVTARRKEEEIQSVPQAVTALSADALIQQSISRPEDLRQRAPGLSVAPSAFGNNIPNFTIRSQLQFEPLLTQDPSVSVYFADVLQARAHGLNGAMYDLQSVQVLKGPQGTLFGRNSTGGAIIITPRDAQDEFEGNLSVIGGNYSRREVKGAINVPVNDRIQLRLAGDVARRDGYVKNLFNGADMENQNSDSWRATVKLRLTDNLTNTTVVNTFKADENGTGFQLRYVNSGPVLATFGAQGAATLAALQQTIAATDAAGFHTVSNRFPADSTQIETFGVSNITEWQIGEMTLKNIYGYRDVDTDASFSYSGSAVQVNTANGPVPVYDSREIQRSHQNTEELQLLGSSLDGQLDWIVGAFGYVEKGQDRQRSFIVAADRTYLGEIENKSLAFFGQGTYKLGFLDGLSLTAGVRHTKDERDLVAHTSITNGTCRMLTADVGGVPLNPCTRPNSAEFNELTWTVNLSWQIDSDKLIYIASRKGYRAGGFNLRAALPSEFKPYQPETVTDFEAGIKADWYPGGTTLRTNIAAYYQDYKDIQRTVSVRTADSALITTVLNAASAHIPGVEAEVVWLPIDAIELGVNYAWSDPTYDKFMVGAVDQSKNDFAMAPHDTASAYLRWTVPMGSAGTLVSQADVYRQTTIQFNDVNDPLSHQSGYTLANARVAWEEVMGYPVDLAATVRNLTDREYYASGVTVYPSLGYSVGIPGAPRTYAVELSYKF